MRQKPARLRRYITPQSRLQWGAGSPAQARVRKRA